MNKPNSRNIKIKLDRRKTRDMKIIYFEDGYEVNDFTFNREWLSHIPNHLFLLFALILCGGSRNMVYLNDGIRKILKLPRTEFEDD